MPLGKLQKGMRVCEGVPLEEAPNLDHTMAPVSLCRPTRHFRDLFSEMGGIALCVSASGFWQAAAPLPVANR
jgi:hypothetical protein